MLLVKSMRLRLRQKMFLIIGLAVSCLLFAFQNCGGGGSGFDLSPLTPDELRSLVKPCGQSTCLTFFINENLEAPQGTGLDEALPTNRICTAVSNARQMVPNETGIPNFTFQFDVTGGVGLSIPCALTFTHGSVSISSH